MQWKTFSWWVIKNTDSQSESIWLYRAQPLKVADNKPAVHTWNKKLLCNGLDANLIVIFIVSLYHYTVSLNSILRVLQR